MLYRPLVIHALQTKEQCLYAYVPICGYAWKPQYTLCHHWDRLYSKVLYSEYIGAAIISDLH